MNNLIKTSFDTSTKKGQLALAKCLAIVTLPFSKNVGKEIDVKGYAFYESVNEEDGEIKNVLAIMDNESNVYTTLSPTVIQSFFSLEMFLSEGLKIKLCETKSSKGNVFNYVEIVDIEV